MAAAVEFYSRQDQTRRAWRPPRGVTRKLGRRAGWRSRGRFWFDAAAARRATEFVQRFCTHTKGELAGERLLLEPWQVDLVENLFGWKRRDNKDPTRCSRRFRVLWLEVPRKNGKSSLASALALLLLLVDAEPGAEIYSAASDREQAGIVFEDAKSMALAHPELAKRIAFFGGNARGGGKTLVLKTADGALTNSYFRVLSSDADSAHGKNAHGVIVDEVHVQKKRHLVDTLRTSTGSRRQPIEIYITTAGSDRNSICWELHHYAKQVIAGHANDDSFLPYIFAAGDNDDWTKESTWRKANPNYDISVKGEYLEAQCEKAIATPGYSNSFRRLHLNQWTEQETRFLDMRRWDRCADEPVLPKPDESRSAFGGLDLASLYDISAFVLAFPPKEPSGEYDILPFFWVAEETLRERVERDRVPYDVWAEQGLLRVTEGEVTDFDVVRNDIVELSRRYRIEEIAADRWEAQQIITQLTGDGLTIFAHGQGFASMKDPTKQAEGLVRARRLRHGGNPVLRWMASNLAVKTDPAGNLKPDREKSGGKIDGMVAMIMAIGRAQLAEEAGSIYSGSRRDGGLLLIG